MKKILRYCFIGALVLGTVACKKSSSDYPFYEAVVTVKTAADNSCYLQLNDTVALKVTNDEFKTNPYKKEVRAHAFYSDKGVINETAGGYQWREVTLSAIDSILTKKPVASGPDYGNAGIEIYKSWVNSIEDGYLTLHFQAMWGTTGKVHRINLVKTSDPLVFELKHDNAGDTEVGYSEGLIAFDLHDVPLPNTSEFNITIKYQGYSAAKELKFHCKNGIYSLLASNSSSFI